MHVMVFILSVKKALTAVMQEERKPPGQFWGEAHVWMSASVIILILWTLTFTDGLFGYLKASQ